MKWSVLRITCLTLFISAAWESSFSQNYYLVVGAFATESDDVREFTSYLPGTSADTAYTVKENNNLLHFYVLKTTNREQAVVNSVKLQQEIQRTNGIAPGGNFTNASPEQTLASGPLIEPSVLTASANRTAESNALAMGGVPAAPKGQYFKFTIAKPDGTLLPGQVHHVDFDAQREVASFQTDTYVDLLNPSYSVMPVVVGVFGYKEVEKYIDYTNPAYTEGAYRDEHGAWVIPYTLERLAEGDVSVMYNVSFLRDAVMMHADSRKELDELVNMMVINPRYVIKVHAHCNGKGKRIIKAMGTSNNYFNDGGAVELRASAKHLTELRAEAVRSYLIEHGIDGDRVKLYGWGATEMLVRADDPHAHLNDRIEIEILQD